MKLTAVEYCIIPRKCSLNNIEYQVNIFEKIFYLEISNTEFENNKTWLGSKQLKRRRWWALAIVKLFKLMLNGAAFIDFVIHICYNVDITSKYLLLYSNIPFSTVPVYGCRFPPFEP